MSGRKEKKKVIARIEYEDPTECEDIYATGARILVISPHGVRINFFWDKLQDAVAEEQIVSIGDKQMTEISKRVREDNEPLLLKRDFVASITLGFPAFRSLAAALNNILEQEKKHVGAPADE